MLNQRGEFYCFGGYSANEVDYPVFNQIEANIDLTPVHNIQQERACGDIDSRLKTRANLNVASRAMLLKGTEKLRTDEFDFRNKHKEVQAIKLLKISWSEKQQIMHAAFLTIKEQKTGT